MDLYFPPNAKIKNKYVAGMSYDHHLINHHKIPAGLVAVLTDQQKLKLHSLIHYARNDDRWWVGQAKKVAMLTT